MSLLTGLRRMCVGKARCWSLLDMIADIIWWIGVCRNAEFHPFDPLRKPHSMWIMIFPLRLLRLLLLGCGSPTQPSFWDSKFDFFFLRVFGLGPIRPVSARFCTPPPPKKKTTTRSPTFQQLCLFDALWAEENCGKVDLIRTNAITLEV